MRSFTLRLAILPLLLCLSLMPTVGVAQEQEVLKSNKSEIFVNSIGMQLVEVPAGEFEMGGQEAGAKPAHKVTITRSFYMGVCEVAKGQFAEFVSAVGYKTDAEKNNGGMGYGKPTTTRQNGTFFPEERNERYTWKNTGFFQGDNFPVVNVSWNDAGAFCDWLSKKEARNYHLPTEAQWEYACRAGTRTRYFDGDKAVGNLRDETAQNFFHFSEVIRGYDGYASTAPVGSFPANTFGLRDMHGNVSEWCRDTYGKYPEEAVSDPVGPAEGPEKVSRGGSWYSPNGRAARCAAREHRGGPTFCDFQTGFRVIMVPQPSTAVK